MPVGNQCEVIKSASAVPTTANLNQSGQLFTGTVYSGCSPFGDLGTLTAGWSYEADASVPLFCINTIFAQLVDTTYQSICIEVTQSGQLGTRAKLTTSVSARLGILAKNY